MLSLLINLRSWEMVAYGKQNINQSWGYLDISFLSYLAQKYMNYIGSKQSSGCS